jgi:cell division septation protein DedD
MKKLYVLTLVFLFFSCGKDEVKPSADSTLTMKALTSMKTIKTAYEEKDLTALQNHLASGISESLAKELIFEKTELSLVPRLVRIINQTVKISLNWQGTWTVEGNSTKNRGVAVFVFEGDPMRLIEIEGDSPFLVFSSDDKQQLPEIEGIPPISFRDQALNGELSEHRQKAQILEETPEQNKKPSDGKQSSNAPQQPSQQKTSIHNRYYVQVGAWKQRKYALEHFEKLRHNYSAVYIVKENNFHVLRIPNLETRQRGDVIVKEIKKKFTLSPMVFRSPEYRKQINSARENKNKDLPSKKEYIVQVGAWKHIEYAQDTLDKLKKKHPDAFMVETNNFHIVRIPGIMTKDRGESIIKNIQDELKLNPILYPGK